MELIGYVPPGPVGDIKRAPSAFAKGLSTVDSRGGWWPLVREPFTGAWQRNAEPVTADTALTYSTVYACVTLIAADIAKMRPRLMEQDIDGIWVEAESPAFSPVLRKPNGYQTRVQFIENWMVSKLANGNAYILKQRDNRGVVVALYVLDPLRVTVLVSEDGSVFYELKTDHLTGIDENSITVPAREIIHDRYVPLFHPLVGVSPITAASLAILQAMRGQENAATFWENGAQPGGVITAPVRINQEAADRIKSYWDTNFTGDNAGKVAVLGDGMTYTPLALVNSRDAQLIEQFRWSDERIAAVFKVPGYKVGVGAAPTYNNVEAWDQQYLSQCLQIHCEEIEELLDHGLGIGASFGNRYGVEFDEDGLLRMDTATRMQAAKTGIEAGLKVDEIRRKFHGMGKVTGGDAVYLQQQNFSLEALAKRDAKDDPFEKSGDSPAPKPPAPAPTPDPADTERMAAVLLRKELEMAA